MKKFVEIAWLRPIDKGLMNHLRNELNFKDDHLAVFDSVTNHCGNADFHSDHTGIEKKRFARLYAHVAEAVLNEIIRLAAVGYKYEHEINSKST